MSLTQFGSLWKHAFRRWRDDNTFQIGAALAFYAVFSLAPVLLIALSVAGLFFKEETARAALFSQMKNTFSPRIGDAIASVVQNMQASGSGAIATIIGLTMLFFGATAVFVQLQSALNGIWGVKPKQDAGWSNIVKKRLWSFAVVLGIGFVLLASLLVSAALSGLAQLLAPTTLLGGMDVWQSLNWLVSFGLITGLFAIVYKVLPDVDIAWRDVAVGAGVTAVLFVIGKELIGLYLGRSGVISAYGAAGSLVIILVWVYYSSQIFLFGAEFTYVYAHRWKGDFKSRK